MTQNKTNMAGALLHSIMETSVDAIITIDTKGIIQNHNSATIKMFGYAGKELLGQNISILMSGDFKSQHDHFISNYLATGEANILGVGSRKLTGKHKNGSEIPIDLLIDQIEIGDEKFFTGIVRDISESKLTEDELRVSEERFRRSQEYANIGTWEWNIKTGELHWSESIGPLFGYGNNVVESTYENFINAVFPDDRERVSKVISEAIDENKPYEIEHRVLWEDGSVHWVKEQGAVIQDDDGQALKMLGVVSDINDRKIIENKNLEQKKLLELTQKCLTDYVGKADFKKVSDNLLLALLEITNSEYGFIGEVLYDELGHRYLKTFAISNISWDESSQKYYEDNLSSGMEFRNLDTLFGEVLKTSKPVISNSPNEDSRAGGLPGGHPRLNSFLGMPIYYGDVFIGMYGLANREGGYDETLMDFLQPYNTSYGVILNARRSDLANKESAKELYKAKKSAEEANKAKSQFLSSMSHELRTPLNAVIGFAQVLKISPNNLSETQNSNVTEILNAGNHLLSLINDVLELTKIESGKIELNIESVNLKHIYDECIALMLPLASEKNITVECDDTYCEPIINFHGDKTRIKQVLLNLLSNAIKYNVQNGIVNVNCELKNNNSYRVSVKDTGKGIAEKNQNKVFNEFERLGEEIGSIEGTGIGLVITKQIVELMGGSIGFESKKDEGSTFWVDFVSGDVKQKVLKDKEHSEPASDLIGKSAQLCKNNFLYIEDNPANLRLVVEIFKHFKNVNLEAIHDPLLGLDIAKTVIPKLILLDINMPGLNGFEVLQQLQENEITKNIPVIAISANVLPKDIERAIEAGFKDYLTKPLNIDNFIKIIKSYIEE